MTDKLEKCKGFDWDDDNLFKKETKHDVTWIECEQIFSISHSLLMTILHMVIQKIDI